MKLTVVSTLVVIVVSFNLAVSSAYPSTYWIDRFDGDEDDRYTDDSYNYRNSRLVRINYENDDDNSVDYQNTSKSTPTRRADTDVGYKYVPIIRYKAARTERKKLFVPALCG